HVVRALGRGKADGQVRPQLLTAAIGSRHFSLLPDFGLRYASAMLAKRIIPCLDVDRGRVVKGTRFLNLRDAGDPVECATEYSCQGADELVFLDITASAENRATMIDVVDRTASE